MTFDAIHSAVGFDTPPRSLRNAMLSEPRLMRRGKDTFGLRVWGGEEYTGIYDELEQAIERAGGAVSLDWVLETFEREFGVSKASVRAYAGDARFITRPGGMLSMRGPGDPEVRTRQGSPGQRVVHALGRQPDGVSLGHDCLLRPAAVARAASR